MPTDDRPPSTETGLARLDRWLVEVEAAAAVCGDLGLDAAGTAAPPDVAVALRRVSELAGLCVADLEHAQRSAIVGRIKSVLHRALDLVEHPDRAPGWVYTEPAILDPGSPSRIVPALQAALPAGCDVRSFLDVGTGVGRLAMNAARAWPTASVVAIDTWEPSLELARANVAAENLEHRITIRNQDVGALDDVGRFDCIWVPTWFISAAVLRRALPRLLRAARPGAWIALGRSTPGADPLADATLAVRIARDGGSTLARSAVVELLEGAGCTSVRATTDTRAPQIEVVAGQKRTEEAEPVAFEAYERCTTSSPMTSSARDANAEKSSSGALTRATSVCPSVGIM